MYWSPLSMYEHVYNAVLQGWVECVGCADRSCYDLTQHTKATGVKLVAEKPLPEPVEKDIVEAVPKKGVIGKVFKKEAQIVIQKLSQLSLEDISTMESQLAEKGYDIG